MDSILNSVKKLLGIAEEYDAFDIDIIMYINSVFNVLTQLGVGPTGGFSIHDSSSTWNDYFADSEPIEAVKTYVAMKVRLLFDPPANSTAMQALTNVISELEWRLSVQCDNTTGSLKPEKKISYNDLTDIPTLNGVELKGNVKMDIASTEYVDCVIGVVSDGEY